MANGMPPGITPEMLQGMQGGPPKEEKPKESLLEQIVNGMDNVIGTAARGFIPGMIGTGATYAAMSAMGPIGLLYGLGSLIASKIIVQDVIETSRNVVLGVEKGVKQFFGGYLKDRVWNTPHKENPITGRIWDTIAEPFRLLYSMRPYQEEEGFFNKAKAFVKYNFIESPNNKKEAMYSFMLAGALAQTGANLLSTSHNYGAYFDPLNKLMGLY